MFLPTTAGPVASLLAIPIMTVSVIMGIYNMFMGIYMYVHVSKHVPEMRSALRSGM